MKLLTKTTLYYLVFTLPLIMISGWFLYNRIEKSLKEEIDEELKNSKVLWMKQLAGLPNGNKTLLQSNPFLQVEKTSQFFKEDILSDTLILEPIENEKVPYRSLATWVKIDGQPYKISFQRSVLEQEDVFNNLLLLMCFVFGGILILFLLINLYINKKIWKPFNNSLEKITTLNMGGLPAVHFDKVSIREFDALNKSLNAMTEKMGNDFVSMKNFTQNASHEIQTPLAIIQSKLELLLQDSKLSESQFLAISSASEATQRLSKLNQSLLLITRIENNQFIASDIISISDIAEKYISFFAEMIEQKNLNVSFNIITDFKILIHPLLADMLVSNLISNAIKYNYPSGEINIKLDNHLFSVSNCSNEPEINKETIFKRFIKQGQAKGNGLGLAIVKEICDVNQLKISYQFQHPNHSFIIEKEMMGTHATGF